ncbi:acyl-CoA dehydrogenase family protein [Antrihabitans stalactiti]|uniref:Acyl-CoA dehydrogenase n=1 Tax=Antrihabitans stalactiti TaxID=2584121 RepID=A0A848KL59_9NOCA|nr:acyl-CoA dehydrogenase family protein [Antrihabitans stalactiti]NMN97000.1 acyl-CoA dehydrogenase [Antrihabitans stalactiti]
MNDEQRELASTVRALVAKHASLRKAIESDTGYDDNLWRMLCDQVGVAGLAIPEEFGGIGAGLVESHIVVEELGRTLVPTPMLDSVVLGGQTILAVGDHDACERLLPGIAEGTTTAAVCWAGKSGWTVPAVTADRDGLLSGTASYVLGGHIADVLIVIASTDEGIAFFEVDPSQDGVVRRQRRAMDPTRRLSEIEFTNVEGRLLHTSDPATALDRIRNIACAALAAEQVGGADRALAMTVEYAKDRKQFGRAIGSFQALKHRMADLHVLVESARAASDLATATLDPADCATAKVWCSDAFSQVAAEAIQLHGGIAITWEHDAHLYFKRAHGSAELFGRPEEYVRRFAHSV